MLLHHTIQRSLLRLPPDVGRTCGLCFDYGDFEGIIRAGQYGGGTVLLWDRGIRKPVSDPVAALASARKAPSTVT